MHTHTITTIDEVKLFFTWILAEDVNFHPDDDFGEYINVETLKATYTQVEALERQALLDRCFEICEAQQVDIYEIACAIFQPHLGTKQD